MDYDKLDYESDSDSPEDEMTLDTESETTDVENDTDSSGKQLKFLKTPTVSLSPIDIKCKELFGAWAMKPDVQKLLETDLQLVKTVGSGEIGSQTFQIIDKLVNDFKTKSQPHRRGSNLERKRKHSIPSPLSPEPAVSTSKAKLELRQPVLPKFYWPEGKPLSPDYLKDEIHLAETEFRSTSGNSPMTFESFGKFLERIRVPLYWKKPFWEAIGMRDTSDRLSFEVFLSFYHPLITHYMDEASKFVKILHTAGVFKADDITSVESAETLKRRHLEMFSKKYPNLVLVMSNFASMVHDIIDTHPGLGFLRDAPEFHSRYVTTVISRIFYKVNRSWNGRITVAELRRSNLLRVIRRLEKETDVNLITEYFSYEHFYVIYCKFWELDKDHDLLIDKNDLSAHDDHALSSRIIERIFSGTVLRGWDIASPVKAGPGKMTYSDFVWFLMSEEDKKTPTAIEYWFRCLDIDGDGVLSPFELQYFYTEQESRLECLAIEPLDFNNVFCYTVDMLRCSPKGIRLQDLKRNPHLAATFFNTFFNLEKYLEHEQRDPFSSNTTAPINENEFPSEGESDWDKYAASEYELLIAEEGQDHINDGSSDMEELSH